MNINATSTTGFELTNSKYVATDTDEKNLKHIQD